MEITARAAPFRHWVIDGFLRADQVLELWAAVPPATWPGWEARYENDCERGKRTSRRLGELPPAIAASLRALNDLCPWLELLTGIPNLAGDATFHGGGLHVTEPGGWLQPHLDYALHPHMPAMERRVNLVAFVNPAWRPEWGGAFELYADDGASVVERVYPAPGRAVVWLPSDVAYHGTQAVAGDTIRATLAAYYLAPARPWVSRKRALFVPRRVA